MSLTNTFWRLFWVQFLGAFVDNFYKSFLLVFLVFESISLWGLSSQQLIALGSFLFILPFFLVSTFAGNVATRFEKSYLVRYIKLWEVALICVGLLFYWNQMHGGLVLVLCGLGLQSTFFGPIKYSILPEYVAPKSLLLANGWIELGTFVSILLGTLLGTQSNVFRMSQPWLFYVLFLAPPLLGLVISFGLKPVAVENAQQVLRWNFLADIKEEMVRFYKNRPVFMTIQGISIFWFNGLWGMTILPVLTKEVFGAPEDLVSLFLCIFTFGIGLGSLLCGRLQKNIPLLRWLLIQMGFLLFWLILLWVMGTQHHVYHSMLQWVGHPKGAIFCLTLFGLSFTLGLYAVALYTALQVVPDKNRRSKAIANNNIYNALYMAVAMILFFVVADHIQVRDNFLIMFAINIVFTLFLWKKFPAATKNTL